MSRESANSKTAGSNLVEGEFAFTASDFRMIADLLYARAGIMLSEAKVALVYSRLTKRLRALSLESFADYCALIASPDGDEERGHMLNALTTNVTRFFREQHHFDHLRDHVLAPRLDALRAGARMRLWSAACSTGQEAYSMALTVLSILPEACSLDIKILATDIDSKVVMHAREGSYAADLLAEIPAEMRSHCAERNPNRPGQWQMSDAARALVTFKELNLIGPWPVKGPFDAIFCRNVAIYFDDPTQEQLWTRFTPLLGAGGRLCIGHSERISGPAAASFASDGLTIYRRLGGRT